MIILEIIGGVTILIILVRIGFLLIDYTCYTVGVFILYLLIIRWKQLPKKILPTLKFLLRVPWITLTDHRVTNLSSKYWTWEPYFKFKRNKR